jgi:peptidylprolyl isomerase
MRTGSSKRPVVAVAATSIALMLSACAGHGAAASGATTTTPPAASPSPSADAGPTVSIPPGPPPTTLERQDLRVGHGARAARGDTVTVQYVGVAWSTRQVFDSSWSRNQPISFKLGAGRVIPGWDRGVPGMRVGGRRELVIPPRLAYGAQGYPPAIGPNETLVFVIDLLKVKR